MINLKGSELPGLLGLILSGLIWSGLVQQVALRVFIAIDADADPTTMVKMQSSATMYSMGMIQASIFNLIQPQCSLCNLEAVLSHYSIWTSLGSFLNDKFK